MAVAKTKGSGSSNGVLAQVAFRARVSTGTVSRVFNNSSLIPSETRSRVLSAARELGFRPRVGVRNKQIALVTEPPHKTVMGGYVNTLTQHICYALSRLDAGITMITEDRIDNLTDCWFDGVIGIAWEDRTIDILKQLHNIPMVWFSENQSAWCHTVFPNCYTTGQIAGEYLLGKGHRKIAVIHDMDYTGGGRVEGVRIAMRNAGLNPDELLLALSSSEPLHLAVKQLIDAGCTAVWVPGEDMRALEVNWLIQELAGKRIPEDISLLGSENPGISEFQRPSLTTIAIPLHEMAEIAVDLVMQGDVSCLRKIELPAKLIERNSVSVLKH
ncbi:LacI family DNA-binding transcriptional regulator [uncultured Victivallis sp.]|uniref:LacI family DNA-binding transcriptional regulator n=1 Tax=uncultured Victivallis sp. TaxID=354118 RepID=UPI0025D94D2E|nr:LacI family DNA-binding transcriptional regulator [uncultured Victivallis sp.]